MRIEFEAYDPEELRLVSQCLMQLAYHRDQQRQLQPTPIDPYTMTRAPYGAGIGKDGIYRDDGAARRCDQADAMGYLASKAAQDSKPFNDMLNRVMQDIATTGRGITRIEPAAMVEDRVICHEALRAEMDACMGVAAVEPVKDGNAVWAAIEAASKP